MKLRRIKFYALTGVFTVFVLLGSFGVFSNLCGAVSFVPVACAATHGEETAAENVPAAVQIAQIQSKTFKYCAAAASIAICALATAMAQSKIGAAGAGVIAERPEAAAMCIVLLAIPETIVILGFVVAAMLVVG